MGYKLACESLQVRDKLPRLIIAKLHLALVVSIILFTTTPKVDQSVTTVYSYKDRIVCKLCQTIIALFDCLNLENLRTLLSIHDLQIYFQDHLERIKHFVLELTCLLDCPHLILHLLCDFVMHLIFHLEMTLSHLQRFLLSRNKAAVIS